MTFPTKYSNKIGPAQRSLPTVMKQQVASIPPRSPGPNGDGTHSYLGQHAQAFPKGYLQQGNPKMGGSDPRATEGVAGIKRGG